MNNKVLLSGIVSVFNGENEIEDCLKSLSFADEIIVVNNSSTDKTEDIARKYTNKIFIRPNNPMLNVNKNFGFTKAKGEWILNLDADERVSPELQKEIKSEILNPRLPKPGTGGQAKPETNGYWIPRKNIIFGKWIEHTGWYPDHQLRLFKNGKGKFEEKHVHEMIKVDGETEYLKGNIIHYNYSTISQFLNKLNIYVTNEAEQLITNGYKFEWQDAIRFPVQEFLSRYFARQGYKDGFHGLILSILMAFYHLLVIAIIWEKLGFQKVESDNLNSEIKKEVKKSYKDLLYWISNEKIKSIKNPLKKIAHKVIAKLKLQ